jgi:hypothetical protein
MASDEGWRTEDRQRRSVFRRREIDRLGQRYILILEEFYVKVYMMHAHDTRQYFYFKIQEAGDVQIIENFRGARHSICVVKHIRVVLFVNMCRQTL